MQIVYNILDKYGLKKSNVSTIIKIDKTKEAFGASYEAEDILRKENFIVGSMCLDMPIGFASAEKCVYIAKWRNIDKNEHKHLSGVLVSRDFRTDDVYIVFFKQE